MAGRKKAPVARRNPTKFNLAMVIQSIREQRLQKFHLINCPAAIDFPQTGVSGFLP